MGTIVECVYPNSGICIAFVVLWCIMSNRKLVSFRLPDDLMQDLRERAEHEGISVTELVNRFLRQGLEGGVDKRVETLVDERIAPLNEQIQELKNKQSAVMPTSPFFALLAQPPTQESEQDMKARLDRLEKMIELLASQNQTHGRSSPPELE